MRIAITGASGFIGSNLRFRLGEMGLADVIAIDHAGGAETMRGTLAGCDMVFHLAGVNRPSDETEYSLGNAALTQQLCQALLDTGRRIPVVYASSTQAALENSYGRSKRAGEEALLHYSRTSGARVHLFRLTNVFGKWARPHYNSVVATFCHQVARGLPPTIRDAAAPLRLVYVDDVVTAFCGLLANQSGAPPVDGFAEVGPIYETTVGELAGTLQGYAASRASLMAPRAGCGFGRALYATYVSHLPPEHFSYEVPCHGDARGVFIEMLKTPDFGQFSCFTAHAGVTRGGHYHHTKVERFLIIKGRARFGFRHLVSGQEHEVIAQGGDGRIVESVPGWSHDVTNVGTDELVIMLWASEIFDRALPDTVACKVRL